VPIDLGPAAGETPPGDASPPAAGRASRSRDRAAWLVEATRTRTRSTLVDAA
jgi:hypothetical protein